MRHLFSTRLRVVLIVAVLLSAGLVILSSGMLFTKLSSMINTLDIIPETAKPVVDLLTGAANSVGEDAITIGAALFGLYVLCIVLRIVKRFFGRR